MRDAVVPSPTIAVSTKESRSHATFRLEPGYVFFVAGEASVSPDTETSALSFSEISAASISSVDNGFVRCE